MGRLARMVGGKKRKRKTGPYFEAERHIISDFACRERDYEVLIQNICYTKPTAVG
jgi:hypothetical protein